MTDSKSSVQAEAGVQGGLAVASTHTTQLQGRLFSKTRAAATALGHEFHDPQ